MTAGAGMVAGGDEAMMGRRSLVRGRDPFGFALSKIPTSRAKNAREMGHPRFSFRLAGGRDNLERVGKGRDPSTAVGLCALAQRPILAQDDRVDLMSCWDHPGGPAFYECSEAVEGFGEIVAGGGEA